MPEEPLPEEPLLKEQPPSVLYSFRRCPYAMRARMGLMEADKHVQLREVVLRDKPKQLLNASPKGTVPVLVLPSGQVIEESLQILLWALPHHHPWRANQKRALRLIATNDVVFKHHLDRYKYANRYVKEEAQAHRELAVALLTDLDAHLLRGDGLVSENFGLADVCIAPFVRQFAFVNKPAFDALPLTRLQAWLARFLSSDLFQKAMVKHAQWAPGQVPVWL